MLKKGAVFIWDITEGEKFPKHIAEKYPQLRPVEIIEFQWQRNTHQLKPVKLGVAILPPETLQK